MNRYFLFFDPKNDYFVCNHENFPEIIITSYLGACCVKLSMQRHLLLITKIVYELAEKENTLDGDGNKDLLLIT